MQEYNDTNAMEINKLDIYGNYIDEVIYSYSPATGSMNFYLHDHLYSPVAIVNKATAEIAERCEYNAYGRTTFYTDKGPDADWLTADDTKARSSSVGNAYTFTGRRLDTLDNGNLELMYYRHRYYDPQIGRFLQQDPTGYVDGLNLYNYTSAQPVISFDPFGLCVVIGVEVVCQPRPLPIPRPVIRPITLPRIQPIPHPVTIPAPPIAIPISSPIDPPLVQPIEGASDCPGEGMNPPGDCTPAQHQRLQHMVNNNCAFNKGCKSTDTSVEILIKIRDLSACRFSRSAINNTCFRGGDAGHREQVSNLGNALKKCRKYLGEQL